MERIFDKEKLVELGKKAQLDELFDTKDLQYFAYEYKKGEFLRQPCIEEEQLQIVISGTISIYCIREDGSKYSLAHSEGRYLLGDMELFSPASAPFYAEALTGTTSIGISLKQYRAILRQDNKFLNYLSETLANKLSLVANSEAVNLSLDERVLNHINYHCENRILEGIEKTAFRLHCSDRQLQRVLNRLESQNIVQKCGKGKYRLI